MSAHLEKEIGRLKQMILDLCTYVEENVCMAVDAVEAVDVEKAKIVIKRDHTVDEREIDIEEECLKILALYQPVAKDLRYVVACLKLNNDLERIGDLAKKIAKNAIKLSTHGVTEIPVDFTKIEEKTKEMLRNSIESLINKNSSEALQVCQADDEVDDLEDELKEILKAMIMKDPANAEVYISLLGVARNLERIADYSTNIAEDVIYLVNGEIMRHKN